MSGFNSVSSQIKSIVCKTVFLSSRSSSEMLSKCKDFLRTTRSRWFQHACCITLWAGQKKRKEITWKKAMVNKIYKCQDIQYCTSRKTMTKVDTGSNKRLFWAVLVGRQCSLHVMPFIFHEQSACKAVGALHQKPETHDLCLNCWPVNKGLWGSLAVDLHISCCPHSSSVGHLMKPTISLCGSWSCSWIPEGRLKLLLDLIVL